jgi:hypothetical protein
MHPAAESLVVTEGSGHSGRERALGYHGTSREAQVVARWHDDAHTGAFGSCSEQPCHAIRQVDQT